MKKNGTMFFKNLRFICLIAVIALGLITIVGSNGGNGGNGGDGGDGDNGGATNNAPVADAGPDQNVSTGSLVTLDGSGSSDADGNTITYSWSFSSKPAGSNATLSDSTIVNPTFMADVAGTYLLSLVVNDGTADSVADTVTITAASDEPADHAWESRGIGGGGALFSASMSPFNANEIYIATDMSAVFRTDDFGLNWTTIDFRQLQGGHNSHVRFTSDPSVLFAVHVPDELEYGTPVRSIDGGETWTALAGDTTGGEAYSLYADPSSTNRILVSSYDTLYFSGDGGTSFQSVHSAGDLHIAGVFWDGANIFVGTQVGLLVSSNGGTSFGLSSIGGIPANEAMVTFAGGKQGGVVRFFTVTLDSGSVWPGITGEGIWDYKGVYRLDWGEANWTKTTTGIAGCARPFFVAMALDNIDIAYVAGGDIDAAVPIVYKTTNGGTTWISVFHTENNENIITGWCGDEGDEQWWYPEYAQGFAVSPHNSNHVIITDFGFAHVTDDGGTTWRQAYVKSAYENPAGSPTPKGRSYRGNGLEDTSAWWLHWATRDVLLAAFTDIQGIRSEDGGQTWRAGSSLGLPHNSTYYITEHPTNGTLYAATSSVHDLYESTYLEDSRIDGGAGSVVLSNDKGQTWQTLHDFGHPVIWLAIDPNNAENMYASVVHSSQGGIYLTQNLGSGASASWVKLAVPPRTEGHPFNIHVLKDGSLVATFSGRRNSSGAFTESSGVFLSVNGGASWQDRSDPGMRRWTKDVVIDPHDSNQNTWYVTVFSHWGSPPNEVGGLYRTTNRGLTWQRISESYRVESMTIDPVDNNTMYFCTETEGLWSTGNLSAANPTFSEVDDYPFRHPTRVFYNSFDPNQIWVTSFGGGLRVYQQ
jgi:hypothetical protein